MNLQDKEIQLFNDYKAGNKKAKVELITSLKPLINQQVGRFVNSGLPRTALQLEGQILTGKAIDTYDPSKAKLNTHVTNYLRKLSRFTTNYQNVGHIPEPRALMIGKYNSIFENMKDDKGREPTVYELADAMEVNPAEIERLQTELRADLSLNIEDSDEEGGFYFFADQSEVDPRLKNIIEAIYFDADPVDKKIMEYIFGLMGSPKLTSKAIEQRLGLTQSELKNRKEKISNMIREFL